MLRPLFNKYRTLYDQSGFWKFKIDPENRGEKLEWFNGIDSEIEIAVPGSWNEQLQEEGFLNYIGAAWYSKNIFVPKQSVDHKIWLWIGSADYYCKAWLNGKLLGEHNGGFLPLCFEITDLVKPDSDNKLILKVDNMLTPDTIPQGVNKQNYIDENRMREETFPPARFDFFPYGGIHRPVYIFMTPRQFINDINVETFFLSEGKGKVDIGVDFNSEQELSLYFILEDNDKIPAASGKFKGNNASFEINNCRFWYLDDPYLYNLTIQLKDGQNIVDEYRLTIGIREIKIDGFKLLLNNKPVFLKGFGKHEDFPVTGKALNLPLLIKDFSLLKWINANSFRTSHYPYAEEVLDLADKKGFLVIDEVPAVSLDFRHITGQTLINHKNSVKELISRDKNHPSIVAWALGNEPNLAGEDEYHNGSGKKYWQEIFDFARTLDKTRPFTVPNCPHAGQNDPVYFLSDFISINRYYGWYENPGQIDLGVKRMEEEMDYIAGTFKKPILVSEFGTDTMPGFHSTDPTMFTEEYQSEFIKAYCSLIESKEYTIGEHIWNFADFKTPQIFRRVVYNLKGVFTRTRDPKAAAFLLRRLWSKNK